MRGSSNQCTRARVASSRHSAIRAMTRCTRDCMKDRMVVSRHVPAQGAIGVRSTETVRALLAWRGACGREGIRMMSHPRHVRRSCDLSSLTCSAVPFPSPWHLSGVFGEARAFARAKPNSPAQDPPSGAQVIEIQQSQQAVLHCAAIRFRRGGHGCGTAASE